MKILRHNYDLKKTIVNVSKLGFVPTMGGIHKGHLSLIKKSNKMCNKTLVSIYVNPTQFNNKKDYIKYPRNIKKDLKLLKKHNIDFVFIPKTREMNKVKKNKRLKLHSKKKVLCGKFRKGHFEGVVNIIDKFLNLINPNFMFLGEKDFQQFFLIKNYVKKKFKVKIVLCKTIRDKNHLALSSRNSLLTKRNYSFAGEIAKKLMLTKIKLKNNNNFKKILKDVKNDLIKNYKIKIDYLELRKEKNLSFYKKGQKFRLFIAYHINQIRLIDNF